MADEIKDPPNADTDKEAKHVVPLYVLEKERKHRQELESKLATFEASAKEKREAEMSEVERAMARVKELEPYAAEIQRYRARDESRRDAMLAALPVLQRDRIVSVIGDLSPDRAIDLLEAIDTKVEPPRNAAVVRTGPSASPSTPSVEEIKHNPSLLHSMSREQKDAFYSANGIHFANKKGR